MDKQMGGLIVSLNDILFVFFLSFFLSSLFLISLSVRFEGNE